MTRISIEDGFVWAQSFAAREWRLLLPVALALLAFPPLVVDLVVPASAWTAVMSAPVGDLTPMLAAARWVLPVFLVVTLLGAAGSLAITALALVPRISVQEALGVALRRTWVLFAALLMVGLAELAAVIIAATFGTVLRIDPLALQSLVIGLMIGVSLVVAVRLATLAAVVVTARTGPVAAVLMAWDLTRGAFWRLFAALLVYLLGGLIVVLALAFAAGSVMALIGQAFGTPSIGTIGEALFLRLALALFWTGFHLLMVAFYRQLGGPIRGI